MGSKQGHHNPHQNMDQNRPGRPGFDDMQKSNPSRQASRTEPSHQKDMQDRKATQKEPKH
ncbi:hypothetical protein [Stenotrophomonas humi]